MAGGNMMVITIIVRMIKRCFWTHWLLWTLAAAAGELGVTCRRRALMSRQAAGMNVCPNIEKQRSHLRRLAEDPGNWRGARKTHGITRVRLGRFGANLKPAVLCGSRCSNRLGQLGKIYSGATPFTVKRVCCVTDGVAVSGPRKLFIVSAVNWNSLFARRLS